MVSHGYSIGLVGVLPNQLLEDGGSRGRFQQRQRRPGDTLAGQPRGSGIIGLAQPGSVPVGAAAVASENQLVLMPLQKVAGELGISRKRIVAGVGRKISKQIGVISQQFIGDAAPRNWTRGIRRLIGILRIDIGPERIRVPYEFRLRIGP